MRSGHVTTTVWKMDFQTVEVRRPTKFGKCNASRMEVGEIFQAFSRQGPKNMLSSENVKCPEWKLVSLTSFWGVHFWRRYQFQNLGSSMKVHIFVRKCQGFGLDPFLVPPGKSSSPVTLKCNRWRWGVTLKVLLFFCIFIKILQVSVTEFSEVVSFLAINDKTKCKI